MSPGNRNSGRKDNDAENRRTMERLREALALEKAEQRAKEEGARRIAERKQGKK